MTGIPKNIEQAVYLFHQGTNYDAGALLGAHMEKRGRWPGVVFRVWAPHAAAVSVVGDFNGWNPKKHPMTRLTEQGLWERFVANVGPFALYKFHIAIPDGRTLMKEDPYAVHMETRPQTACRVFDLSGYTWNDSAWLQRRAAADPYASPMNIYEVHLGSWRTYPDGEPFSYEKMADELIPYAVDMGYTHLELMPVSEYPYDGSWGYQVTGYYAPTSRFGKPTDFMAFVDRCHQAGLGVLLDWVPAHFPKNSEALSEYDGAPCYEYVTPDKGEHKQWGTKVFDYGRCEVQSFLVSNALYWLDQYHIDGLRVDAVASMLYLDYMREPGEWQPNDKGGNDHVEAVAFLQKLNAAVRERFPDALMIAEESSAWDGVTRIEQGGLGFTFKWNMGWMNDLLEYVQSDPVYRGALHNKLTFPLTFAFSEKYILPISHDEVVHGKKSLLDKMPGSYEQKFAGFRCFLGYMMSQPGKKLLFMGQEFGQFIEWDYQKELDWLLLQYPAHSGTQRFVRELNHFYLEHPPLWEDDNGWNGFQWIDCADVFGNIIVYRRIDRSGNEVIALCNFSAVEHPEYRIGAPQPGVYNEVFSTDRTEYGGGGLLNGAVATEPIACHGLAQSLNLKVPALSTIYLARTTTEDA